MTRAELADEIARAAVHMARSPQNCIAWGGGFLGLPPRGINCSRAAGDWRWAHPQQWENAIRYARESIADRAAEAHIVATYGPPSRTPPPNPDATEGRMPKSGGADPAPAGGVADMTMPPLW